MKEKTIERIRKSAAYKRRIGRRTRLLTKSFG